MKKLLPLLALFVVSIVSCQPEIIPDPNNPLPVDSCRIQTAYYYGGSGGINDSANFIYSGGKLIRVENEDTHVFYTYNGNRLVSLRYVEQSGNILYRIDSFQYINDTIISRVVINDYDLWYATDTLRSVMDFTYTGNKLTRSMLVETWNGFPDSDTLITDYRWTGGNVSSIYLTSNVWVDDSVQYQYDNNPNYFRKVSPNFFITDPFFQLYVGLEPHLPLFISTNNAVNYSIYGGVDYPLEYETDSMMRPTLIKSGGFEYMGYKYECP